MNVEKIIVKVVLLFVCLVAGLAIGWTPCRIQGVCPPAEEITGPAEQVHALLPDIPPTSTPAPTPTPEPIDVPVYSGPVEPIPVPTPHVCPTSQTLPRLVLNACGVLRAHHISEVGDTSIFVLETWRVDWTWRELINDVIRGALDIAPLQGPDDVLVILIISPDDQARSGVSVDFGFVISQETAPIFAKEYTNAEEASQAIAGKLPSLTAENFIEVLSLTDTSWTCDDSNPMCAEFYAWALLMVTGHNWAEEMLPQEFRQAPGG